MASKLVQSSEIQTLLDRIGGLDRPEGDARIKSIVRRIVSDVFTVIDEPAAIADKPDASGLRSIPRHSDGPQARSRG